MSVADVASVLGSTEQETEGLIEAAGREIAEQIRTDVLIIEDEPLIALDLQAVVEDLGIASSMSRAPTRKPSPPSPSKRPGLILADIQLADGSSGLEAVNEILRHARGAGDLHHRLSRALPDRQRPEPAFLITKPFLTDTVKAVISQALFFLRKAHRSDPVQLRA